MYETLDRPAVRSRDISIDRDDLRVRIAILIEFEVANHARMSDKRIDSRGAHSLPKVPQIGRVSSPRDRVEHDRGTRVRRCAIGARRAAESGAVMSVEGC